MTEIRETDRFVQREPLALPAQEEATDLLQFIDVLWHRRWTIALCVVLCLAGGFLYLARATPIFRSTSRLYVEKEGPAIISEQAGFSFTASKNYLYTQAELLKSVPIVASAFERLRGETLQTFAKVDNPVGFLKKKLDVEVGRKDELLTVAFESPYPVEAAKVVNAVVDAYVTYLDSRKRSTAAQILKILREEKVKREAELSKRLEEIVDFKRKHGVVVLQGERGNILIQQLSQLSDALIQAELEEVDAKAAYEAVQSVKDDPEKVRRLADQTTLALGLGWSGRNKYFQAKQQYLSMRQALSERLLAAEEELIGLEAQYTDSVPAVRAARKRVETLREELARVDRELKQLQEDAAEEEQRFVGACLAAARHRWEVAKKKVAQLKQDVEAQRKLAEEAAVREAEFAVLQSELDRTRRTCELIDDRIKELNLTEDTGALNVTVVEVAKPEDKPVKPRKALTMALCLMLGLMAGVGLAFFQEWIDQRVKTPEEASAAAGSPLLGVIPHASESDAEGNLGTFIQAKPSSPFAEAFRTVRTAVFFGVPQERSQILLITSPGPSEGKSSVGANLAIAMAQAGQRVLVIDGDFRRPIQHRFFEVDNECGLSNVLVGDKQLSEAIKHTSIQNLDVLPCGPRPVNPAELLNSEAFTGVVGELCKNYDRIILDSPPVLGFADSRILAALAHATILVVRCENTSRKAVEAACEALASVGGTVLGVVANDMNERSRRYGGYGYYYGYHHYYGKDYARYYSGNGSERDDGAKPRRGPERLKLSEEDDPKA